MILFSKFKENVGTLFLDTKRELHFDPEKNYIVILSPSLYWIKRVTLPLSNVYEVKKVVATLFEDILPDGYYSYDVVKDGDGFLLFAYEDKKIKEILEDKGLHLSQVKGITFAQLAYSKLQSPCRISDDEVLSQKDGIVIVLPSKWFNDIDELDEKVDMTSLKHKIELKYFNHTIETKTFYKVAFVLFLFVILFTVEYGMLLQQKEFFSDKKEELFSKYSLKPTMMQNRSILQKYEKIDAKQRNLRNYLAVILGLSLKKGERIEKISVDDKSMKILFTGIHQKKLKNLLSWFYKKQIQLKIKQKSKKVEVEIAL